MDITKATPSWQNAIAFCCKQNIPITIMTQTTVEAQVASSNFDALAFELKHAEDFKTSETFYFEPNYEVDTQDDKDFGKMGRIWDGKQLIGTFYYCDWRKRWVTTPFYLGVKYIKNNESYLRFFETNQLAEKYIKRLYQQR